MDIQIGAEQAYLNDVEIWAFVDMINTLDAVVAADNAQKLTLTEMSGLIYAVEILADSQQLCYINDARFLLSIMNQ